MSDTKIKRLTMRIDPDTRRLLDVLSSALPGLKLPQLIKLLIMKEHGINEPLAPCDMAVVRLPEIVADSLMANGNASFAIRRIIERQTAQIINNMGEQ